MPSRRRGRWMDPMRVFLPPVCRSLCLDRTSDRNNVERMGPRDCQICRQLLYTVAFLSLLPLCADDDFMQRSEIASASVRLMTSALPLPRMVGTRQNQTTHCRVLTGRDTSDSQSNRVVPSHHYGMAIQTNDAGREPKILLLCHDLTSRISKPAATDFAFRVRVSCPFFGYTVSHNVIVNIGHGLVSF